MEQVPVPVPIDDRAEETFHGVDLADDPTRPISEEVAMWQAVVARTWLDSFLASDWFLSIGSGDEADPDLIRGEARRWMVLDFGEWKDDRESVCAMAGIDPDRLRKAALKKLAEVKAAESEKRTAQIFEIDRAFARLLDDADDMGAADLDAALTELAALESQAA